MKHPREMNDDELCAELRDHGNGVARDEMLCRVLQRTGQLNRAVNGSDGLVAKLNA